jgi:tricorn protease
MASDLSNGKVGYVHLSDFSDGGTEEFLRQFYSQTDKQAVVVDGRWSSVGDTSQVGSGAATSHHAGRFFEPQRRDRGFARWSSFRA